MSARCAFCGFTKDLKPIPASARWSEEESRWVCDGPCELPPALLASAYTLAAGETRSELVHNRPKCWTLKQIYAENKQILARPRPMQTRHAAAPTYMPPPTRTYNKQVILDDMRMDSGKGEWQELGLAFVPADGVDGGGSAAGPSASSGPSAVEQPDDAAAGQDAAADDARGEGHEQQHGTSRKQRVRFADSVEGGTRVRSRLEDDSFELEPIPTQMLGRAMGAQATSVKWQAWREATGSKPRAPPQTLEQRTDPSSRINERFLSAAEKLAKVLRKGQQASEAEREELVREVKQLQEELGLFDQARDMLEEHGLPDTPRELATAIVSGDMQAGGIMSFRIADHVENCQINKYVQPCCLACHALNLLFSLTLARNCALSPHSGIGTDGASM